MVKSVENGIERYVFFYLFILSSGWGEYLRDESRWMWKNVRILKDSNFLWKCFLFVLLESYVYLVLESIWFRLFFFLLFIQFPHEYCFSYALKQRSEFLFPLEKNFLYKEFNFLTRILHTTVRGTFPNSNPVPIRLNKISLSLFHVYPITLPRR